MTSILTNIQNILPDVYAKAQFNQDDLIAMLQGLVGFGKAIASKDPMEFIDAALGIAASRSGKQCLKSLQSTVGSIKKWLTFGKKYTPLKDSSDLDFDQVDVGSVPEIMKVTSFNFALSFINTTKSFFMSYYFSFEVMLFEHFNM